MYNEVAVEQLNRYLAQAEQDIRDASTDAELHWAAIRYDRVLDAMAMLDA